ncbi:precorrin-6y C5,15-methyltransferase (decarboxylating) subunit CbiE [Nocardioides zeae]|uniref:Precorrin-6y C5,15-methyltransferase (Decarboxylating) subunit CbiE n=1 Tax=Nocardioides imazamoxiresistens TaxID=3231893 RepID=A0ABU3PYG7_9ACTN|nr:precorrin-6y C5,15-methyltransferase (decarboxylating) subunit CbiE [Nocardioides zeae]MDT9594264.1 precorrin-6y C5,15-methyltransferase (decarboxylating) subunit CbiE [Nocardioides zeae]
MITVVGIGADGWPGLPERHRATVRGAEVLLGGARHLALVPDAAGQERVAWPSPLRAGLPELLERYAGRAVVALASGDPLLSGVGTTLAEVAGADAVRVEPAVSSVALAGARMGWPTESLVVVSAVARDVRRVLRELAPGRRVLVLSSDATTPADLAALLAMSGWGASTLTVLGDLGAADESRVEGTAAAWADEPPAFPRLNVVALDARADAPVVVSWAAGLPDDAFEHDGQLTKRDVRAAALARLAPAPGALLWDVGAGAGSVGIEWMRAHPACRTVAVEVDATRAARVRRNAGRLGVPDLRVVTGAAPAALAALGDLERPDAVFVGGGATRDGVLDACRAALVPGGRLVVHGVTIETEALLAACHAEHGGELVRLSVETATPIGGFRGFTPARAVTQWSWTRPATSSEETP